MVGALLDVGSGKMKPREVEEILKSRIRTERVVSACKRIEPGEGFLSKALVRLNRKLLKRHWNWLIDLIFPGFCPICEESSFLDGDHYTCLECLDKIAWISGARCKLCGISMAGIDFQGLFCSSCRENDFSFDEGRCMFALDQCGRKLIHELKYRGARDVIRDFSAWKERVPDFLPFLENSILVPVPLHSRRMRSRGYNQSLWIAQAMVKEVGENSELSDCLKRIRNTPTQTKNDREERKENRKGSICS